MSRATGEVTLSGVDVDELHHRCAAVKPGMPDEDLRSATFWLVGYLGAALDAGESRRKGRAPRTPLC